MVVEKLGFFSKLLGAIGKRFIFKFSQKINLYTCALIVQETVEVFKDVYGSYEVGMEEFNNALLMGVRDMVADMMDENIMFGKGLGDIVSRDPLDTPNAIGIGFWALMGAKSKKMIEKPIFIPAEETEEGIAKVVIGIKQCPFCCGADKSIKDKLKEGRHYGDFFALMIGGIIQEIMDYVGREYNIESKETKCFMDGDGKGELTLYFHPREPSS
ncbi:MAG: hypothetical protein GF329_19510 [Candidatus Lokiarchaeota archaeon]|nr:hypothetical protein [Candidatus Lokiarchaeota archaeon]